MQRNLVWLAVVLGVGACSSGGDPEPAEPGNPPVTMTPGAGVGMGTVPVPGAAGAAAPAPMIMNGTAGSAPAAPDMRQPMQPEPGMGGQQPMPAMPKPGEQPPAASYDYENEQVALDADLVVASGKTLRIGPGVTFTAKTGVKIQVDGMLIAEGTAAAPVRFQGAGMPRSWHGIVIGSGGYAGLTHVQIGGATYGIHALPGSDFAVDRAELGTSFKAAVVESDGSFSNTKFHASGDPTFSPVNEVTIDDVNGTLTILNASPSVTNSSFDGSAALVDMVRIGGKASPTFDHVHIADAHCAFHINGGVNNSPKITNSVMERLGYGIMAYATKPIVENSVFRGNGFDIGFCFDATAENKPELRNNFYAAGQAGVDPSCFQIGADEPSPATMPNSAAGPVGL